MLITLHIEGYKAIASLDIAPGGQSVTLTGENGAGKSTATEAIWWGLGGDVDGEPVRAGEDAALVKLTVDDEGNQIAIRRRKARGKPAKLVVEDVKDGRPYGKPTTLLERFRAGIGRQAFTMLDRKKRLETVKRMAPSLDVSAIEDKRAAEYAARTKIGNEADALEAQAAGVVIPESPEAIGEEIDLAAVAGRRGEIEKQIATNEKAREQARALRRQTGDAEKAAMNAAVRVDEIGDQMRRLEQALSQAKREAERTEQVRLDAIDAACRAEEAAAALVDPDPSEIDGEIAKARAHNAAVAAARTALADRERALAQQAKLAESAATKRAAYKAATERIAALDAEKAAQIAAAACPVEGLALDSDEVVYPGKNGPVPVDSLSTGEAITLNVLVARALGVRMIPVPGWGEVDRAHRDAINALAEQEPRVQLLRELTTETGTLEVVIEEAPARPAKVKPAAVSPVAQALAGEQAEAEESDEEAPPDDAF